jgi:metal-responsive CopG/Arc/MetJ family transcriptional regulator
MKSKTSLTLSKDLLKRVDRIAREGESRSATIERLIAESLSARARRAADAADRAAIDRHARELNAEAEDVLGYQVEL